MNQAIQTTTAPGGVSLQDYTHALLHGVIEHAADRIISQVEPAERSNVPLLMFDLERTLHQAADRWFEYQHALLEAETAYDTR